MKSEDKEIVRYLKKRKFSKFFLYCSIFCYAWVAAQPVWPLNTFTQIFCFISILTGYVTFFLIGKADEHVKEIQFLVELLELNERLGEDLQYLLTEYKKLEQMASRQS